MASATQIRADSVARQAVLAATSPLKLFAGQLAQSDAASTSPSGGFFSNFEDALNAARQTKEPKPQHNAVTPKSDHATDATSKDDDDSISDDSDAASPATADANAAVQKSRTHDTTATGTGTNAQGTETTAVHHADPAAASADPAVTPTPSTAKANPASDKSAVGDDAKANAASTESPPDSTAQAIAVSQQIAGATASAQPEASVKKALSKTPTTAEGTAVVEKAQPADQPGATNGVTPQPEKPAKAPLGDATNKKMAAATAQAASNATAAADSTTSSSAPPAPSEPAIKPLAKPPTPSLSAPTTSHAAAPSSSTPTPTPDAAQIAQQSIAAASSAAMQSNPTPPTENSPSTPSTPTINTISGTASASLSNAADSADAAAPAQQLPNDDHEQTFQQVIQGLRGKMDPANGKAEIRLDPPNLGTLHVSITLTNGSLTAQFQSASDVVRDLLKSNLEKLKSVLEGQGVAVDKLAVEAPAGKVVAAAAKGNTSGGPNNDGRSAGQYNRDPQSGQRRPQNSAPFARLWNGAASTALEDAPIDVVG